MRAPTDRSRACNPRVKRKIDEWWFHYNDKTIKVNISMSRPRDPEADESERDLKVRFSAYFDIEHMRKTGLKSVKFSTEPVTRDDINAVLKEVRERVQVTKDTEWIKVIAIAVKGRDHDHDGHSEFAMSFNWGVGLMSPDKKMYRALAADYVRPGPACIIRGFSSDDEDIKIHAWSQELEDSLRAMDDRLDRFSEAMKVAMESPEAMISSVKSIPQISDKV